MISALVNLIIWLLVLGIVYWLAIYVIDAVGLPDPPARILKVAVTVIVCLAAVLLLLSLLTGGSTGVSFPRLVP